MHSRSKVITGGEKLLFSFLAVNSFHVRSPDVAALSAERGIGLRRDTGVGGVGWGGELKHDKGFWGIVRELQCVRE